jgi:uncharacterized integral membrane protein
VFGTLGRLLKWAILLPVLIAVVLLAVANSHTVTVHLNPFDTADPVLRVDLALYQLAFVLFVFGTLIGGIVSWRSQLRNRRRAHERGREAAFDERRTERSHRSVADADAHGARPAGATAFLPRPERG